MAKAKNRVGVCDLLAPLGGGMWGADLTVGYVAWYKSFNPMSSRTRPLSDIEGRSEVECVVDRFYAKVRVDDLLGPIFDEIAKVDWNVHLPKLYAFWQTVLFGNGGFRGNPLAVHANLLHETPMDWSRFQRWLDLFLATVDELFKGERADHMKNAANDMAHVIYSRINNIPNPRFDPANLTPEQRARYAKYREDAAS